MKIAIGILSRALGSVQVPVPGGLRARGAACASNGESSWIPFSRVIMDLAARRPRFLSAALARLGDHPADSSLLDSRQIQKLRQLVRERHWEGLDHFPTFTVLELERTIGRAARERKQADTRPFVGARPPADPVMYFAPVEPLGLPTRAPVPKLRGALKKIGAGLELGEELDPALAGYAADSLRLAELLNRLALNGEGGAGAPFQVTVGEGSADSPQDLLALLAAGGHEVEVRDARYFANFGDMIYKGRDVFTPFWLDTKLPVPGTGRILQVPVSHSEHELSVRGPQVNAELAFFFGADGKATFRTNIVRNQGWILGRIAWRYRGAEALEAIRLAGVIIRTYDALQKMAPELPLGGYLTLGVCNDVNAAIELHMNGQTTLFPLTRDPRFFAECDGEVARLMRGLPVDGRDDGEMDVGRLLSALPVDDLEQIPWLGLRQDLERVKNAECGVREVRSEERTRTSAVPGKTECELDIS